MQNQSTGINLGFNQRDLSITAKPSTLSDTFLHQLHQIAGSINMNLDSVLGMLTVNQIAEVVAWHREKPWGDPQTGEVMYLNGIEKTPKGYFLCFDDDVILDGDKPVLTYKVSELNVVELLSFLSTIEKVLTPCKKLQNTFAS